MKRGIGRGRATRARRDPPCRRRICRRNCSFSSISGVRDARPGPRDVIAGRPFYRGRGGALGGTATAHCSRAPGDRRPEVGPRETCRHGRLAPTLWLRLEGRGHARAVLGAEVTSLRSAGKSFFGACGGEAAAEVLRPEAFWPGSSPRAFVPCGSGARGRAGYSTLPTAQVLPRRVRLWGLCGSEPARRGSVRLCFGAARDKGRDVRVREALQGRVKPLKA